MNYRTNPKKEQLWKTHIAQARQFEGGMAAYCRSQNISISSLNYWRGRFAKRLPEKVLPAVSPFVPVKVETAVFAHPRTRSLPDAKWLAKVISELYVRCQ
ncbi:MAG: IS66 family insertion sequence element accessory protein TnpA [Pseudobdellovibrionaceae bacterium]